MAGSTIVETRDRLWSPVLERLSAPALDCVQTGLAALADLHHGAGTHVVLGAPLGFAAAPGPGGVPRVEPPVDVRLAEARQLAGLRATERRDKLDGPGLRRFAADAGTLYVIADAFDMVWTPYCGQRHMEHSLVLVPTGDRFLVVDPYHNETQWGAARPGVWRLAPADLDAAAGKGVSAMVITAEPLPELEAAAVLAGNANALAGAGPDIARYVAAVGGDVDQLVLDVWLLGRSRLLHAAWLATVPEVPAPLLAAAREQSQEWLRLAAQSYVGMRRAQRGAPLPPSVVERLAELLHGDVDLAARLAEPLEADVREADVREAAVREAAVREAAVREAAVREAVVEAVRLVLRLPDGAIESSRVFRTLPNFNSFRLVDIIERVETGLGVDLDAEDLTLESLHDIDSLTRLFVHTAERARR